jgi:hypothetical protein
MSKALGRGGGPGPPSKTIDRNDSTRVAASQCGVDSSGFGQGRYCCFAATGCIISITHAGPHCVTDVKTNMCAVCWYRGLCCTTTAPELPSNERGDDDTIRQHFDFERDELEALAATAAIVGDSLTPSSSSSFFSSWSSQSTLWCRSTSYHVGGLVAASYQHADGVADAYYPPLPSCWCGTTPSSITWTLTCRGEKCAPGLCVIKCLFYCPYLSSYRFASTMWKLSRSGLGVGYE